MQGVRRRHLGMVAAVLVALAILGSVGSVTLLAHRSHHNTQPAGHRANPHTNVPSGAPSAPAIFDLPYTKGVRSAEFSEVDTAGGARLTGSGVMEFAPEHAFSETQREGSVVVERAVQVGGVSYNQEFNPKYQATQYEAEGFEAIGWDGAPPPDDLWVAAQTRLDGQQAWVLKEAYTSDKWVVGEQTGDPLQVVIDGNDTYTFSHWGQAPAIQAPPAGDVSTQRYSGSGSAPVVTPGSTVAVLKEQTDAAAGALDPAGFQTIALDISYRNTASAASEFDNGLALVTADGMFATPTYTTLTPALKSGTTVAPGQTITGWDEFVVPRQATSFDLLFGEQPDQSGSLDYLISISVPATA